MGCRVTAALAALLLALSGCSGVAQQRWTRIDGTPCMTTHVAPVWWSAETMTDCMVDGKPVELTSNHDDVSIVGYPFAAMLPLIAVGL